MEGAEAQPNAGAVTDDEEEEDDEEVSLKITCSLHCLQLHVSVWQRMLDELHLP